MTLRADEFDGCRLVKTRSVTETKVIADFRCRNDEGSRRKYTTWRYQMFLKNGTLYTDDGAKVDR
jgi:hypothetical protein